MKYNLIKEAIFIMFSYLILISGCKRNRPPNPPGSPSGPSVGYKDSLYTFTTITNDPNNDGVCYRFDWDDGDTSDWNDWMQSGLPVSFTHSWSRIGTYYVTVQAKDANEAISLWSNPHHISIETNLPNTPTIPSGPSSGGINILYEFSSTSTDLDCDSVAIRFDWGDGDTSDWSSFVPSGESVTVSHSWSSFGDYYVRAQAKDIDSAPSSWSSSHQIIIINRPPNLPSKPSGPSSGKVDTLYSFSAFTTDPDDDSVAIRFDWGDGDTSDWSSFVPSGEPVTVNHSWSSFGDYYVRAQAKDEDDTRSLWSSSHQIEISCDAWSFITLEEFNSSPALFTAGNSVTGIIVGCHNGFVYCLDSLGRLSWEYPQTGNYTGAAFNSSPAFGTNGVIYIGDEGGNVHAINPSGTQKWKFTVAGGSSFNSSPAIDDVRNRIYIGCENDTFYALNTANGTPDWKYGAGRVSSSPAIASDGAIIFGDEDSVIYILNPDGSERHVFFADGAIFSSPTISGDKIYFGAGDKFYALDTNGTTYQTFGVGIEMRSSPTIGFGDVIYFGDENGKLHALNPDLTPVGGYWPVSFPGKFKSSVAIGSDGLIYFVTEDNYLCAYCLNGTEAWRMRLTVTKTGKSEKLKSSPVIGPNGWVYAASIDGIYAFYRGATLATTPWPKFRHDIRNTGRVGGPW